MALVQSETIPSGTGRQFLKDRLRSNGPPIDEMATAMIRCIHLYTGADGRSRVDNVDISLGAVQAVEHVHFEETAAGVCSRLAHCPARSIRRHLVGHARVHPRDGETFVLRPGNVLWAADTTGSGHRWRLVDHQP